MRGTDIFCMRKISLRLFLIFMASISFAQTKPLYRLPEQMPEKKDSSAEPFLVATNSGLYRLTARGGMDELWTEGSVSKILRTESGSKSKWYFITSNGIISTTDLINFTECNKGLPVLTVKEYEGGQKKLVKKAPLLKGLEADPTDNNILVTATKDAVYLSKNAGQSWISLGSTSLRTCGVKSVAVAHMPKYDKGKDTGKTELVVFMSHPVYGFAYIYPDRSNPTWVEARVGFGSTPGIFNPDEISDIVPVLEKSEDGSEHVEIYCAQTFLPNFYRYNWKEKKAVQIYHGDDGLTTFDSICKISDKLYFTTLGEISSFNLSGKKIEPMNERYPIWKKMMHSAPGLLNAVCVPPRQSGLPSPLILDELWLLTPDECTSPYAKTTVDRKALYISAYQVRQMAGIEKYRNILKKNNLNAVVVDMKDDAGLLRFVPNNESVKEKAYVSAYKIDVEQFVKEFKKDGTYLIARIVVFKDKNLVEYDQGQYAIWNNTTGKRWLGIRSYTASGATYYPEYWVDPYSEEVWEYNVAVANELVERGFDEVQFDYIRFPTDGINMGDAVFRWKDEGMDKESALMSFLAYARKNIKAPIGIDIYGLNGWHRSGTSTGQDVEMLSQYVDVICPMFYPSHFEQFFMDVSPSVERPYRIYFYGTYRNSIIGRNKIVVRPWVQAFYMRVSYDEKFYDKDYVKREVFGVRDALDRGYMYWNNSGGNYDDVSPDPAPGSKSPWKAQESDIQKRLPAFSSRPELIQENLSYQKKEGLESESPGEMITILDSVVYPEPDSSEDVLMGILDSGRKKLQTNGSPR